MGTHANKSAELILWKYVFYPKFFIDPMQSLKFFTEKATLQLDRSWVAKAIPNKKNNAGGIKKDSSVYWNKTSI